MTLALEKAGYRLSSVDIVEAEAYHPTVDSRLMGLYCKARGAIPAPLRPGIVGSYIIAKRYLFAAARRLFGYRKFLGQEHLLAVAEPR